MSKTFAPGTKVEVRNRFDSKWNGGFEIISQDGDSFRVRRLLDKVELPDTFDADEIRSERDTKKDMWWI